ncbi:MAG: ATP-binding cassette domain-containing protein [Hyphomonadaceae bacterium]|nr:ATP-binding cassette domain-containing protein [Hyphomonadaceae bacterium]
MARPPLLTLTDVQLTFGGRPLFSGVEFPLSKGERCALVGRNGAGKSTLMKLVAGWIEPDAGEIWAQPGSVAAFVAQEPDFSRYDTLVDFTADGLDDRFRAEAELTEMGLDPLANPATLSGGQLRKAAIARGFAHDPDILLMDEPTNHLDIATIQELETRLTGFNGAALIVSHDRAFLETVSTNTLWLRQGKVLKSPEGYGAFEAWAEGVEAEEEKALARMKTQLKDEHRWLARGVTGRRKRNQGRLAKLKDMRAQAAQMRSALGEARAGADLSADSGDVMSRKVIETRALTKSFTRPDGEELMIVKDLSLKILRGDRVGFVGPNGIGKTTLLKLLLGEIAPDEGSVKLSKAVKVTYLDQARDSLKAKDTLWETLAPSGGDHIMVQGKSRHVAGYAKDFLFMPEQLRQPVGALSGGERNRLTLAVSLAQPCDVLVLDEPTNDLDMQTLDLLEDMLTNYEGTLLLVSHDRAFLDGTVTSCLVPTERGQWLHVPGGWSDALAQVPSLGEHPGARKIKPVSKPAAKPSAPKAQTKLSFKDEHRLKEIEAGLPRLAGEIEKLEAELADPALFEKDPDGFQKKADMLAAKKAQHAQMEEDWLEIEEKREALQG